MSGSCNVGRHSLRGVARCTWHGNGQPGILQPATEYDLPLHKQLEVVPTAGPMYGIDTPGILDVLDLVSQLDGRIPRQPRESRLLPETSQKIEIIRRLGVVAAGASWPHGVSRHDMDDAAHQRLTEEARGGNRVGFGAASVTQRNRVSRPA